MFWLYFELLIWSIVDDLDSEDSSDNKSIDSENGSLIGNMVDIVPAGQLTPVSSSYISQEMNGQRWSQILCLHYNNHNLDVFSIISYCSRENMKKQVFSWNKEGKKFTVYFFSNNLFLYILQNIRSSGFSMN